MLRNNCILFISLVLCFLLYQFTTTNCNQETFINTSVKWCNGSSEYDSTKLCLETLILKSNSLVDNIPVSKCSYVGIVNQTTPVLHENSLSNVQIHKCEIVSNGVTEIQPGALTNSTIYRLYITDNNIEKLNRDTFKGALIESVLELSRNGIKLIEDGTFSGMILSSLDLSMNNLEDIPSGVFTNLTVEHLSLARNNLKTMSRAMFQDIISMGLLDLEENSIKVVEPGALDRLNKPAFVYLQNNSIETIPAGVFNSQVYVQLLLSDNKIKTISPDAFHRAGFVYLNLSGNCLESIDKEVFGNVYVEYLTLSYNKIREIEPYALKKVPKGIQLDNNELEVIKKDSLSAPRIIVLLNNKLRKIENGAFGSKLKGVRDLYLETDNNLDEESKNYLHNLNVSGKFEWRDEITTTLLFPFE